MQERSATRKGFVATLRAAGWRLERARRRARACTFDGGGRRARTGLASLVALWITVSGAAPASAAVIVTLYESGPDVILSGGGTLDLSGLIYCCFGETGTAAMVPESGQLWVGAPGLFELYRGESGPSSFGSGGAIAASTGTGDVFGFRGFVPELMVPNGYVSNSPLEGSATFAGQTFDSLGVEVGTYVWSWGSGAHADTFTLQVVPEPSTGLLLAGGLLAIRASRRRPASGASRGASSCALGVGTRSFAKSGRS